MGTPMGLRQAAVPPAATTTPRTRPQPPGPAARAGGPGCRGMGLVARVLGVVVLLLRGR